MTERKRPIGPPTENEVNLKVSDLISNETKEWEKQRVERSFPHLADNILSIKTRKWGGEDKQVLLKHKSGSYTTKTGYLSATEAKGDIGDQDIANPQEWLKDVWKIQTAPKLKLFIWKIKHGALPVGDRLEARHILSNSKCTHCDNVETISHLFLSLAASRQGL